MDELLKLLNWRDITFAGVLLVALWTIMTGKVRLNREYEDLAKRLAACETRELEWKKIAMETLMQADSATLEVASRTKRRPP